MHLCFVNKCSLHCREIHMESDIIAMNAPKKVFQIQLVLWYQKLTPVSSPLFIYLKLFFPESY